MARADSFILDTGSPFPALEFAGLDGQRIVLPRDFNSRWSVLLFYRGHWWPYCRQQLLAFQRKLADFQAQDVTVIAASVDPLAEASQTRDRYALTFPIGYGLDVRKVAEKTGAFFEGEKGFLHSTDFVIDPQGNVANAVYSSGAIGRLVPDDCLGFIRYHKENG